MFTRSLLVSAAALLVAANAPSAEPAGDAIIPVCQVASIERQEIPGADAGVLVEMIAKEGMKVKKDMEVARIDDREAKANVTVKQLDFEVAEQEANSTIGVEFASGQADVAKTNWEKMVQANRTSKSTISEIEVLKAKLEWQSSVLRIKKAEEEHDSAVLSAKAKKAEVDASQILVDRRVLRAPFDGVVVRVAKHVGEWITPGEPVIELVRVDRLSVRGTLAADKWNPSDIEGKKVTVEVSLPRGRTEKVSGQVVFVSPVVEVGGQLPVWAEIDSPVEDGRPLVRAGLMAKMTIHVNQPVTEEKRPVAAPRTRPSTKAPSKG